MWKYRVDYLQTPHAGRSPSDEAVHYATMKYIATDYDKNKDKMTLEDRRRIHALLVSG